MYSLICLFSSLTFLTIITTARAISYESGPKLSLTVSPPNPKPDHLFTVSCRILTPSISAQGFSYIDLQLHQRVLMYMRLPNRVALRNSWKGRHMEEMAFNPETKTLTVTMAAERRDNGEMTCNVVVSSYPNEDFDLKAKIFVHIQQAPSIRQWSLNAMGQEPGLTFKEHATVHATCVVDLGWPEASISLDVSGRRLLKPTSKTSMEPSKYRKATHNKYVTLSDRENGARFVCTAKNRNGVVSESRTVHVWYSVRDMKFPYLANREYVAGTVLRCSARGNPAPMLNITVTPLDNSTRPEDYPQWIRNASMGLNAVEKKIPKDAKPGAYQILCTGTNTVSGEKHSFPSRLTRINITAIRTANMALIVGPSVAAGVLFLLIVFCCCKNRKKKAKRRKQDECVLDYRLKKTRNGTSSRDSQTMRQKDSLVGSSIARPETVWSEESAFSIEPKWPYKSDLREDDGLNFERREPLRGTSSSGLGSSAMGSSYQREEDLDCPISPQASLATLNVSPRKPPRLNHHHSLDNDLGASAISSAPPFPEDVAATIHDPTGKAFEAEEEFV